MRRFCLIFVLVFVIGCSVSGPVIRTEEEKIGEATKEIKETAKETSKDEEIAKTERKEVKTKETAIEKKATIMAEAEEQLIAEITGLIIEQTMTRIGYEFYENFFIRWEAPEGIKDYNIFINERAGLWGSWVRVDIDSNTAWQKVLRPRSEEIEEAAKEAVEATKEYLANYEETKRKLERGDLIGSGI